MSILRREPVPWQLRRRGTVRKAKGVMLCVACLLLSACSAAPSPLNTSSPRAAKLAQLVWIASILGSIIFVLVVGLMLYAIVHRPSRDEETARHPFGTRLIWLGGIAAPLVVLSAMYVLSLRGMSAYTAPATSSTQVLTLDIVGHQWWWEVRYPSGKVVTANEVHIPIGQSVKLTITSNDVIHSFWVPQLQGKIDAIPGETNTLWLEASQSGTYRGQCLVYCALQHANMNFRVVAEPQNQFNTWLAAQAATPAPPTDPELVRGQTVFMSTSCQYCHAIAGTQANGTAGPDLTHLASRQRIAAETLPNTADALRGWIQNPDAAKPGVLMPKSKLSQQDLDALVAYLQSLK